MTNFKKIKTKNGFKIKYSNGTTSYFYPHGTGKRHTKNSAFTGIVKYFHSFISVNKYTNDIIQQLYISGLNKQQARGVYNNNFRNKLDKDTITKIYNKFKKQKLHQNKHFQQEIKYNREGTTRLGYRLLNKTTRQNYFENALIKTSNGISRLVIFNKLLSKKGFNVINEFITYKASEYTEGSPI